jgi:hypothetical protein
MVGADVDVSTFGHTGENTPQNDVFPILRK